MKIEFITFKEAYKAMKVASGEARFLYCAMTKYKRNTRTLDTMVETEGRESVTHIGMPVTGGANKENNKHIFYLTPMPGKQKYAPCMDE